MTFSLDETDRMALRLMKGLRVSFSEREDAYILLAEVVRATMKLTSKGNPSIHFYTFFTQLQFLFDISRHNNIFLM